MAPFRRRTQQQRGGMGVLLLAGQIMQIGADRIPPVTLATVIFNAAVFLKLIPFPSVENACTSYSHVILKREWKRIVFSSFFHLDDMHLYFNMASFIWKGMTLERKLKSRRFAIVLVVFSLLTQILMIGLNYLLYEVFSNSQYLYTCAAGFSGVVFALKVLTTAYSENNVSIMGFPIFVPARYACWVELIVIQLLIPNASFTGHLAGILVGLLYIHGPLKKTIKITDKIISGEWLGRLINRQMTSRNPSYTYVVNDSGGQNNRDRRPYNTHGENDEDEALQNAIRESLRSSRINTGPAPSYGWNIPAPSSADRSSSNHLYPTLDNTASAPPLEESDHFHTTPPYPVNDPPYPTHHDYIPYAQQPHRTSPQQSYVPPLKETTPIIPPSSETVDSVSNPTDMRNARLRRFEKKY